MQASLSLASSFRLLCLCLCGCGCGCVGVNRGTKRKCGNRYASWQATRQNSEANPGEDALIGQPCDIPKAGACCPGLRGAAALLQVAVAAKG